MLYFHFQNVDLQKNAKNTRSLCLSPELNVQNFASKKLNQS